MKKILTVFSLAVLFNLGMPAFAAPPPPPGGAEHIRAGHRFDSRRPPMPGSHHHRNNHFMIYTSYPHHDYFYNRRTAYCMCPYCLSQRTHNIGFYIHF